MNKYAEYKEAYKAMIKEALVKEAAGMKELATKGLDTVKNTGKDVAKKYWNTLTGKNLDITKLLAEQAKGMDPALMGEALNKRYTRDLAKTIATQIGTAGVGGASLYGLGKAVQPEESNTDKVLNMLKSKFGG